jgi:hypothetical protein
MTYAHAMPSSRFALSASRLAPRLWSPPESFGTRDLRVQHIAAEATEFRYPMSWLGSALQRLGELAELGPGWDEAAAQPIPSALVTAVRDFLTSGLVSRLAVQPDIVPTFRGGLLIEWHTESVDLIIESTVVGSPSFYFLNNETGEEVEAPLGQRLDAVAAAFAKLAH